MGGVLSSRAKRKALAEGNALRDECAGLRPAHVRTLYRFFRRADKDKSGAISVMESAPRGTRTKRAAKPGRAGNAARRIPGRFPASAGRACSRRGDARAASSRNAKRWPLARTRPSDAATATIRPRRRFLMFFDVERTVFAVKAFTHMDTDGNHQIDFPEFVKARVFSASVPK